jgi:hypothetical protein
MLRDLGYHEVGAVDGVILVSRKQLDLFLWRIGYT